MKFKVGDKVRVINGQSIDRFMDGRECEVIEVDNDSYYQYYITDFNGADWMVEHKLELIKEKQMKKEDLKSGMLCKYNEYNWYDYVLIYNGTLAYIKDNKFSGWDELRQLVFDNIVSVYDASKPYHLNYILDGRIEDNDQLPLLWNRENLKPIKEMTVSEIANELGYEIKVVADD